MKKIIFTLMLCIIYVTVFAQTEEHTDYVETTKYFKTIYVKERNSISMFSNSLPLSYSIEVSQEEYDNYNPNNQIGLLDTQNGTTETNYKKMTTSIVKLNATTFRYTVKLHWKTMPSTRSYDIIGIGYGASVKAKTKPVFEQNYCLSSGECKTTSAHTPYIGTNGVGASFILPSSSINSLSQNLYIDVIKTNTSSTILRQDAYGDYSHAQKSISSVNSQKYIVDVGGIELNSSIDSYYDHINTANAWWACSW